MNSEHAALRLDRRRFIGVAAVAAGFITVGRLLSAEDLAFASVTSGTGPYGPLQAADGNGIQLPAGFASRLLATSGSTVPGTSYIWHGAPDGGACFPAAAGGWLYVSNSEVVSRAGGVGVLRFSDSGDITDAYRVLSNTTLNCAGGTTPWGTWLSCEENGSAGKVYECDPFQPGEGVLRAELGSFNHESASVDAQTGRVYLTEDDPSGRLYRFTPAVPGDLSAGVLEAARVSDTSVSWQLTSAAGPDRQPTTTAFNGGEGSWISGRSLFFTTKGNNRVYELALDTQRLTILYDAAATSNTPLTGVDSITAHPVSADLFVAEDGGNMELCIIATVGGVRQVAPFLRINGQNASEITGPAFSPDGTRLYLSSQRGTNGTGITYEIVGPFRTNAPSQVVVSRVNPNLGPGASWREVYVDGSGFNTGTSAALGDGVVVHQTVVNSSSRLTLKVSIAETAVVGPRTALVAASGGAVGTCGDCFLVLPPPVVTSVTPSVWMPGSTNEVRITGSFNSWGVTLGISGTGATVSGVRITTSLIVATITVAAGAPLGERLLSVRNGDQGITRVPVQVGAGAPAIPGVPTQVVATPGNGQASVQFAGPTSGGAAESYVVHAVNTSGGTGGQMATGTASPIIVQGLTNGQSFSFIVIAINSAGQSQPSSASDPVVPSAPSVSTIVISSVSPGLGPGASNREVYVNGTGFAAGCRVAISAGVVVGAIRSLTGTRIAVAVTVAESAAPGPRDVTVTAPDGTVVVSAGAFNVLPPPTITSVTPNSWALGSTQQIEISGGNFSSWGLAVSVSGTGVTVSSPTRVSASLLRVTIGVAGSAASGTRILTVRNGDQGVARANVLVG